MNSANQKPVAHSAGTNRPGESARGTATIGSKRTRSIVLLAVLGLLAAAVIGPIVVYLSFSRNPETATVDKAAMKNGVTFSEPANIARPNFTVNEPIVTHSETHTSQKVYLLEDLIAQTEADPRAFEGVNRSARIMVRGFIEKVTTTSSNGPATLRLRPRDKDGGIDCRLPAEQTQALSMFEVGDCVVVRGALIRSTVVSRNNAGPSFNNSLQLLNCTIVLPEISQASGFVFNKADGVDLFSIDDPNIYDAAFDAIRRLKTMAFPAVKKLLTSKETKKNIFGVHIINALAARKEIDLTPLLPDVAGVVRKSDEIASPLAANIFLHHQLEATAYLSDFLHAYQIGKVELKQRVSEVIVQRELAIDTEHVDFLLKAASDVEVRDQWLKDLVAWPMVSKAETKLFEVLLSSSDAAYQEAALKRMLRRPPTSRKTFNREIWQLALGSNPDVRRLSMRVLERNGPAEESEIQNLQNGLMLNDSDVRVFCLRQLGSLGKKAEDLIDKIAELLHHGDVAVRQHAAWAVGAIGTDSREIRQSLMGLASDSRESVEVREAAIISIGKLEREPFSVGRLVEFLTDESPDVRRAAMNGLCLLKPPFGFSHEDNGLIVRNVGSKEVDARRFLTWCIRRLGPLAVEYVDVLMTSLLFEYDLDVRTNVLAAFEFIAKHNKNVEDAVFREIELYLKQDWLFDEEARSYLRQCFRTYKAVGGKWEKILPMLKEGLRKPDSDLPLECVYGLLIGGAESRPLSKDLARLLRKEEYRRAVREAMLKIRGEEVVQALADLVGIDDVFGTQYAALKILADLGPEAIAARRAVRLCAERNKKKDPLLSLLASEVYKMLQ